MKSEIKPKPEADRPKDKSKPVSSNPVSGSPWCVVWTGDGKQFFYNPSKRLSVWELPDDLKVGLTPLDQCCVCMCQCV